MEKKTIVITTTIKELSEFEFLCNKCKTIHRKSPYAIAQKAMNVRLVFTCSCGNKINL